MVACQGLRMNVDSDLNRLCGSYSVLVVLTQVLDTLAWAERDLLVAFPEYADARVFVHLNSTSQVPRRLVHRRSQSVAQPLRTIVNSPTVCHQVELVLPVVMSGPPESVDWRTRLGGKHWSAQVCAVAHLSGQQATGSLRAEVASPVQDLHCTVQWGRLGFRDTWRRTPTSILQSASPCGAVTSGA